MNRRWWFLILFLALVIAGLAFRFWFPALMTFVGANSDAIQGLAALVQIVIWLGAGALIWFGWLRQPKTSSPQPTPALPVQDISSTPASGERSVQIAGDAKGNIIITGDNNKVVRPEPEISEEALRTAYLNRVYEATSFLTLAGIDRKAASQAEARLSLNAVYTALLTLSMNMDERFGDRSDPRSPEWLIRRPERQISALEQLNRHNHLVLLGDPGSGKSTFANFVALCLAGEALRKTPNLGSLTAPISQDDKESEKKKAPKPQEWKHGALLPVRVILRDFAARGLPSHGEKTSAKHLWKFIAAELEACELGNYAPYLHKQLQEQGGLLMLDGLDEVPEAEQRRVQIKTAVEDFASSFPKCRILVTSRTYAYQKQDWRLSDYVETVLAPFSGRQIEYFVDHWYEHIALLRDLNPQDAQGRAELLKRAISNSERLRELAERPLLLTLMASLHAWRGGTLPESAKSCMRTRWICCWIGGRASAWCATPEAK